MRQLHQTKCKILAPVAPQCLGLNVYSLSTTSAMALRGEIRCHKVSNFLCLLKILYYTFAFCLDFLTLGV